MGKLYLFNVYTFFKSLRVINVGSIYGLHGVPIYILYLYDQMWLVGYVYMLYKIRFDQIHPHYGARFFLIIIINIYFHCFQSHINV